MPSLGTAFPSEFPLKGLANDPYNFSFAILKPLSHVLPVYLGGGYFGPRENCIAQTAASASGGLTSLFVAAVPAMYHLGLMTTPKRDIGRLFLLTTITAFYGLFFAIPLRKYHIRKCCLIAR